MFNFNLIKDSIKNFDKKVLNFMKKGLLFCLTISAISSFILCTYLFLNKSILIYEIGILLFQTSLYFAVYFIISAIVINTLKN